MTPFSSFIEMAKDEAETTFKQMDRGYAERFRKAAASASIKDMTFDTDLVLSIDLLEFLYKKIQMHKCNLLIQILIIIRKLLVFLKKNNMMQINMI
jgi:hypothetical protein